MLDMLKRRLKIYFYVPDARGLRGHEPWHWILRHCEGCDHESRSITNADGRPTQSDLMMIELIKTGFLSSCGW